MLNTDKFLYIHICLLMKLKIIIIKPFSSENVLYVVNFKNIFANKIQSIKNIILINVENILGYLDSIEFWNKKKL